MPDDGVTTIGGVSPAEEPAVVADATAVDIGPVSGDPVESSPGEVVDLSDVPIDGQVKGEGEGMNDNDYGMLKMHCLNGAQRQADGASLYAENLRYDYLEGKGQQSISEGLGYRVVTESGSGRSRAETNRPAATSAASAT